MDRIRDPARATEPGSGDGLGVAETMASGDRPRSGPPGGRPPARATPQGRYSRALAFLGGCGSLLDLWPVTNYEEVYPYKADDVCRRSAERLSAVLRHAFREVHGEQEEGPAIKIEASDVEGPANEGDQR